MFEIFCLGALAFFAGLVDAAVGGGGLIQIPALFILLKDQPAIFLIATSKFVASFGTAVATYPYMRRIRFNASVTVPGVLVAFVFSFLGAQVVSLMRPDVLRPIIWVVLIVVAAYVFWKKELGGIDKPKLPANFQGWVAGITGAVIGFYDGFFGPGTGSFLIFIFVMVFGFDFLHASATAKFVNLATNLSALLYFLWKGYVLFHVAVPMAVCNIGGSVVGAHLALRKGSGFVRKFFLVVLVGMIGKFGYDLFF